MCWRSPVIGLLRGHFGFLDRARLRRYTFLVLGGLKANPLPWLLGEDDPSVRYSTLVDILDAPPQDRRVVAAKKAIMEKGIVPKILAKQKKGGFWEKAGDFYIRTKYTGTVWQLIVLAELGAEGNDPKVQSACDFVLRVSQDRESGGFSYLGGQRGGGYHSAVIPCLTGNMVWSLIRLGFLDDPRVKRGVEWITDETLKGVYRRSLPVQLTMMLEAPELLFVCYKMI